MAYADYGFYQSCYCGDVLEAETARRWLERASDELDSLTFGRLTFAMPVVEAHEQKVKKAVCAVAEALYHIDIQCQSARPHRAEDGSYRGAVSSVSSGRESVSYASNGVATTVYAAAASSEDARRNLICNIAAKYLANIPDARGINLLYAGEVHHVRQHDYPV